MRILIRGGGFENRGAEAMLRTTQRELGRRLPGATFHAFVPASQVALAHANGISCLGGTAWRPPGLRRGLVGRLASAASACLRQPSLLPIAQQSLNSACQVAASGAIDAVVDVSGYRYGDAWPQSAGYRATLAWATQCQALASPYIFLPQAWGPFSDPRVAAMARRICSVASLVYARDGTSLKHLQALLPGATPRCVLSPDVAFRFRGAPDTAGQALLRDLGVAPDQPIVGVAPNMRVYERAAGEGAANRYVEALTQIANHCVEQLGATVVLLPNEVRMAGDGARDDRFLCSLVEMGVSDANRCVALLDRCATDAMMAALGQLDLLVGSRFHSLVLALSSGVPLVAVGWAHKYGELLKPFGLSSYSAENGEFDLEVLVAMVNRTWAERARLRQTVLAELAVVRREVDGMFDDVAALILEANP